MNYFKFKTELRKLGSNVESRFKKIMKAHVGGFHHKGPPSAGENRHLEITNLFSVLKNLILIVAVYLYFTGWIYLYRLYDHFGISFGSIDIPFYYFFIYSYSVISDWVALTIIIITIILIYLFISLRPRKLIPFLILISILLLFFRVSYYLSEGCAYQKAKLIRQGYDAKKITFIFKSEAKKGFPSEFLNANCKGKLRLITHTKDKFYVVHQLLGREEEIPYGHTYEISKNDVLLAKIEMLSTKTEFSWLNFIGIKFERRMK